MPSLPTTSLDLHSSCCQSLSFPFCLIPGHFSLLAFSFLPRPPPTPFRTVSCLDLHDNEPLGHSLLVALTLFPYLLKVAAPELAVLDLPFPIVLLLVFLKKLCPCQPPSFLAISSSLLLEGIALFPHAHIHTVPG